MHNKLVARSQFYIHKAASVAEDYIGHKRLLTVIGKKCFQPLYVVVVLKHGIIELVFLGSAARIQALSPVFSVRAAENPAAVILGFKNIYPRLMQHNNIDFGRLFV